MNDDFMSVAETSALANADPIDVEPADRVDPIQLERKIGATRASVKLMSGLIVTGDWAAGDSQAFRRLIGGLMDIADGATARVDRAERLIVDLSAGTRVMRDQLRIALDDVDSLHSEREVLKADAAHRIGELMAEITVLQAAAATPAAIDADMAALLRERTELTKLTERLRAAYATETRRADAAVAQMQAAADRVDVPVIPWFATVHGQFYQKAVNAARAADEAFEGASWKEGARYLKLANTWIGLLNAVASQETLQTESG